MANCSDAGNWDVRYVYDGQGQRVRKDLSNGSGVLYEYDAQGGLVAEYGSAGTAGTQYPTVDHLGSTRVVTDATQAVVGRYDYEPFGRELLITSASWRSGVTGYAPAGGLSQRFTGKERDGETGLDYFGARYMSAAQGRFTAVDPHNIITEASSPEEFGSFLSHPQNWNRYAYVTNNPLSTVDPDGRCPACMMWARLSPYADKAVSAVQRGGQSGYLWATSFFNSPAGQQAIQTTAELAGGTVMPGSPIAGVNAQMGSRILTALGSSDAAK